MGHPGAALLSRWNALRSLKIRDHDPKPRDRLGIPGCGNPKEAPGRSLLPTDLVLAQHDVIRLLGRGAFADVWLCADRDTGGLCACKVIATSPVGRGARAISVVPPSPQRKISTRPGSGSCGNEGGNSAAPGAQTTACPVASMAQREAALLCLLTETEVPRITRLHQVYTSAGRVELLMDYCPGGDLFSLILSRGRLPERAAKLLITQLASTLASCHALGVLHRDIKPENIYFDADPDSLFHAGNGRNVAGEVPVHAVLADFGVAVRLAECETIEGDVGTKFFQAPEVARGTPYGFPADVWSLGTVLYAMLAGSLPPSERNHGPVHWFWMDAQRGRANLDMLHGGSVTPPGRSLLRAMLQLNPARRPSPLEILRHPWITGDCQ